MRRAIFEELLSGLHTFGPYCNECGVIAVINVVGLTNTTKDYVGFSVQNSFLTDDEIDEFINGWRALGVYVQHFSEERDFMSWVLSGGYQTLRIANKFVYTSALNGIGPGRRALIPSFCNYFGIPTLNSDPYACAINRHKFHWTRLLSTFGIPVPRTWCLSSNGGWEDGLKPPQGTQVIAKATYEGSSLGVSEDSNGTFDTRLHDTIRELANTLNQPITVQELIPGFEAEVPVIFLDRHVSLGTAFLSINGSVNLENTILTYDTAAENLYRYTTETHLPGAVPLKLSAIAERVAGIMNYEGISRVDFRVTKNGTPYVIDISSTPHLTTNNAVGFLFTQAGLEYRQLLSSLLFSTIRSGNYCYSSDQNSNSDGRNPPRK